MSMICRDSFTPDSCAQSRGDPAKNSGSRLVAVVVTHNRLSQLKTTLAQLLAAPAHELQAILVIDNAATDGTSTWLARQRDTRLIVHRVGTNLGGAGGFSIGIALAQERFDPDWVVVMDDDARPTPGALAAFHARDKTGIDAVAAAVRFPDGRICEMNRPARNPFWSARAFLDTALKGRRGFHLGAEAYRSRATTSIDVTSFVGFFISRQGMARAGLPDPGLFLYGDDGLYTLGLRNAGGRMVFDPTVRFEHDCSTFAAEQRGRFVPLWKVYYYHRNLLLLYRLAAGWMFWPALAVILPKWLWKARVHGGDRAVFLSLMLRAVRDGLLRTTDVPHDSVLGWARRPRRLSGSGYRGDSAAAKPCPETAR
nr:glycosyltransferase [Roseovarius nanhaiticus]